MISVICSDAGGAEIVSSWLFTKKVKFKLHAVGPAKKIFKDKFKNIKLYNLEDCINDTAYLLSGTSSSNYELSGFIYAKKKGIKTISYLDSWTEYLERYKLEKKYIFPDEIWVCDIYAYNLAKKKIKDTKISLKGNFYFKYLKYLSSQFKKKKLKKNKIVFVSSPIKKNALLKHNNEKYYGYTEDDVIRIFFEYLDQNKLIPAEIIIKLHPSENNNSYKKICKKYKKKYKLKVIKNVNLYNSIIDAEVVIGANSMALVVAKKVLNKKVINLLPFGIKSIIPYKSIKVISL